MSILQNIPKDLLNFILVSFLSLLIGLEQRRHHLNEKQESLFGTDRTYTFIGILGFILYVISPNNLMIYSAGGFGVMALLIIFYYKRIEIRKQFGITSIIIVFITYTIAPLIYLKPIWLSILLVTTVLVLTEIKTQLMVLSSKFKDDEFITLAKFLVMAGIVLPLLPHKEISNLIPVSAFKIWLAVVVISGISYLSYLLQKFLFPKKGIMITGFLGGLYSSTATTIVLARRSKTLKNNDNQISAAIFLATEMMLFRIYILAVIFLPKLAFNLAIPFSILAITTLLISFIIYKLDSTNKNSITEENQQKNPLEFKTALLFAMLFIIFTIATKYILQTYGIKGLNILSIIVGVTDIDPFLLSLFTGKYAIDLNVITNATLIAVSSNNLLKAIYAITFGTKGIRKNIIIGFSIIILTAIIIVII